VLPFNVDCITTTKMSFFPGCILVLNDYRNITEEFNEDVNLFTTKATEKKCKQNYFLLKHYLFDCNKSRLRLQ
jgi:hypothetical protein